MKLKDYIGCKYFKFLTTSFLSILLTASYGQNKIDSSSQAGQSKLIDSIDIVRDYRPILADAVKVRRSPDMNINREGIERDLRRVAAQTYFSLYNYKQAYNNDLLKRHPNASQTNIDNYRISYIAYLAREYERATSILETLDDSDAFYQGSFVTLGHIALETGDKVKAKNAFFKALQLNYDPILTEDVKYNYAKVLHELDSIDAALDVLEEYIVQKYPRSTIDRNAPESAEKLSIEVLLGTSNFHAGVSLMETLDKRDEKTNSIYQRATYYRALEFYNERAFENSISMFMRSEKFPLDETMAALATYWKAEAMYEVRKYKEAVENFSRFLRLPSAKNTDVYNFAHYALAYAAFRNNSFSMSANYFERFLIAEGESLEQNIRQDVIARLGDCYVSMRNYSKAREYYNQLIKSRANNQDYALFQLGIILGLEGNEQAKINTLMSVVDKFPSSNYADDVAFEIPYTYFTMGAYDQAIEGLKLMIERYPRSSYVPRALMTIGLVHYNNGESEEAMRYFQKVVEQYTTSDEAVLALRSIENIYLDEDDAIGYIHYATNVNIKDLSPAEQDNMIFQTAHSLFAKDQFGAAVEAVNAYFDKFPKPRKEKHARYIRGVSYYKIGKPNEALHDLNIILNDWTSEYTESALLTAAELYMELEEYNEAIVHLKKLEITTKNDENYSYALTNLMVCYLKLGDLDQVEKYSTLIKNSDRTSDVHVARAHIYMAENLLLEGENEAAMKELNLAALKTQSAVAAEARYRVGEFYYNNKQFEKAEETAFDVINNMSEHDYWVAKSFLLLADTYSAKGNKLQAKSTLQSIIENYEGDDDIVPSAKERLQKLK